MNIVDVDVLIDQLVEHINSSPCEGHDEWDAPLSVRLGTAPDAVYGMWDWNIRRGRDIHWVAALKAKLPNPFPKSFRSLITRYVFPQFEWGPLQLLANTPEGTEALYELRTGIFEDKYLSKALLQAGFIQFARPAGGSYDPICFDSNQAVTAEYPIVIIDHEGILCHDKIRVTGVIADSFSTLVMEHLAGF